MNFVELANGIFSQSVADYHKTDNVDAPIHNPYQEGTIEYDLYLKNWIDAVQWHLEDIIRDPDIEPITCLNSDPLRSRWGSMSDNVNNNKLEKGRS